MKLSIHTLPTSSNTNFPVALAIGGSDCSGGAGIQADLRTFAALGVYATAIPTAITLQTPFCVYKIDPCDPSGIIDQITAVLQSMNVTIIKIGMLTTLALVDHIIELITPYPIPIVLDPVLVSSSGMFLLDSNNVERLAPLFHAAEIVTPNIPEATYLTQKSIHSVDDMIEACGAFAHKFDCMAVALKGGHLSGEPTNVLWHNNEITLQTFPRIKFHKTHGTGCCFASAFAAFRALGFSIHEAFLNASSFMHHALSHAFIFPCQTAIPNPIFNSNFIASQKKTTHTL